MTKQAASAPWTGIVAGIGAAVFYTLANVFLRKLATGTDPVVVVFMKALITASIFVPWLCWIASQGTRIMPTGKYLWIMLFGAAQTQVFGNCGHQVSLGVIGLAIGVPIYMGSLIASSAILGWLILKEKVATGVVFALGMLVLSIVLLSLGGEEAGNSVKEEQTLFLSQWPFSIGVLAAIGVGVAFALLGVCMRYVLQSGVPIQTPLVFVSLTGTIGFGLAILVRDGTSVFVEHSSDSWLMMIAAGVSNAIAFLCLSVSLKLLPVVYVNAINVSQVAMAAALGVYLFGEPLSIWLQNGLVIMIVGFALLAHFSSRDARKRTS